MPKAVIAHCKVAAPKACACYGIGIRYLKMSHSPGSLYLLWPACTRASSAPALKLTWQRGSRNKVSLPACDIALPTSKGLACLKGLRPGAAGVRVVIKDKMAQHSSWHDALHCYTAVAVLYVADSLLSWALAGVASPTRSSSCSRSYHAYWHYRTSTIRRLMR
jgi:hypothetical protein